ncbi:MAG: c-type cytochrome [Methyloceanibacter sp.]
MPHTIASRFLVAGVAVGALLTLGAAADVAPNDDKGAGEAPTPERLLQVPITHIIPGNINVTPNIKNPVADDSDAVNRGMKYFDNFNCSGCHAANGAGGMGPALSNHSFKFGSDRANIYLTIAQGRPTGMPAWGTLLPSSVIWDLVAYIGSISNAPKDEWGTTTSLDAFTIEQVPAEFQATPTPWQYTEPFSFGQKPTGEVKAGMKTE